MTDNPAPGPRRDWDNDRDRGTERDRLASPRAGSGPSEDIRHLSESEERDLHFNGYPPYNMEPLHELCYPGVCRYKTDAENNADLGAWYRCQEPALDDTDLEAIEDDPEAGL